MVREGRPGSKREFVSDAVRDELLNALPSTASDYEETTREFEPAAWERPFMAVHDALHQCVEQLEQLPFVVRSVTGPLILVLAVFYLPFVLLFLTLHLVIEWVHPRDIPILTREELVERARDAHSKWMDRHRVLCVYQSVEVADRVVLPILDALWDAIDGLGDGEFDRARAKCLADELVRVPIKIAPDAHSIGLCIRRNLRRWGRKKR